MKATCVELLENGRVVFEDVNERFRNLCLVKVAYLDSKSLIMRRGNDMSLLALARRLCEESLA